MPVSPADGSVESAKGPIRKRKTVQARDTNVGVASVFEELRASYWGLSRPIHFITCYVYVTVLCTWNIAESKTDMVIIPGDML